MEIPKILKYSHELYYVVDKTIDYLIYDCVWEKTRTLKEKVMNVFLVHKNFLLLYELSPSNVMHKSLLLLYLMYC